MKKRKTSHEDTKYHKATKIILTAKVNKHTVKKAQK